jgi:hypothetical protein
MLSSLLATLLLALAQAEPIAFEEYVSKFAKKYGPAEFKMRREIFQKFLVKMHDHNDNSVSTATSELISIGIHSDEHFSV